MKFGPKLGEAYILVRNTGSASIYFNFYLNLFDNAKQFNLFIYFLFN